MRDLRTGGNKPPQLISEHGAGQQANKKPPARPYHADALRRADQIESHMRHFDENPRSHAKALRDLGVPTSDIRLRAMRGRTQRSLQINEQRANKAISLGLVPRGDLFDRTISDLQTAAIYSPAGIYQAGKAIGGDAVSTAKGKPTLRHTTALGKLIAKGTAQDFEHPLRHPGFTGLDVFGALSLGAGATERLGLAGKALAGGELKQAAKHLATRPAPGRIKYKLNDLQVEAPASRNTLVRQGERIQARYLNRRPDSPTLKRKVATALERQTHIEAEAARAPSHLLAARGHKLNRAEQMALRVVAEGKPISERIQFHREQGAQATSKVERADHARQIRLLRAASKYVSHSIPTVEPGHVRLYRGEGKTGPIDANEIGDVAVMDKGNWFSDTKAVAEEYAKRNNGRLYYIDVPKDKAHPWGRRRQDDHGRPWTEYRFPEHYGFREAKRLHEDGKPRIKASDTKLGQTYGQLKDVGAQREKILAETGQMDTAGLEARRHAPGRVIEGAKYERTPAAKGRVEQVREYPGRSKTVTRPRSPEEAKARLAQLDNQYEAILGKVADAVNPHDNPKLVQLKRNYVNSRLGRGKHLGTKRQPTVSQEARRIAETKLDEIVAKHPEHPIAKRYAALRDERTQLRDALNEHAFNNGAPLPSVTETIPGKPRRVHLREVKAQRAREGLVGAEDFKGGEVYVPAFKTEPRGGTSGVSQAGSVVGSVRKVVSKNKHFTGESLRRGQIPDNTTGLVARQTLRAVRYLQSDRFRKQVLKAGSDERKSEHDVLVSEAVEKGGTPAQLSPEAKAVVGKENYTLDELSGHTTAFEDFRRKLFPMQHRDDFTALSPEDRLVAQEGGKVKGYKWVDERLLRGINRPARTAQTKAGQTAVGLIDSINNASKLAILYLKPAYALPNIAGNTFLNIVDQGFAAPANLKRASYLSHKVGEKAAATIDSIMGEGVANAIASDRGLGQKAVNFAAGKWSRVVDLPFRRASFINAARKLGYDTPQKLQALVTDEAHHADLLEASQRALDEIIDYSRLSDFERSVVRRVIFFYPWVKGSTRYAGHFVKEHPAQAAAYTHLAQIGKDKSGLGPVPSYLEGSFKVGGKLVNPAAAGIFGTTGQVAGAATGAANEIMHGQKPKQAARLAEFLTPAVGLGLSALTGEDSRGIPFRNGDNIVKKTLVDSLPQAALLRRLHDLRSGADQSQRIFPVKNVQDAAGPFLGGGIVPRDYNADAIHAQAAREEASTRSSEENARISYKQHRVELSRAIRHIGGTQVPKQINGRLNLRLERRVERTREKDPLVADINVVERHGWISKEQAQSARAYAEKASKSDRRQISAEMTARYFDRNGDMSDFYSWLRDHGVDVYVPPL